MQSKDQASALDAKVTPRFSQPATFLRAPLKSDLDDIDIALMGIPYDLGSGNRSGTRHGPAQVREMSRLIRRINGSTGVAPFELARIGDIGDAPVNPFMIKESIDEIEAFVDAVLDRNVVPVSVGGDHTITLPVLRAIGKRKGPVGVIHFDSHSDCADSFYGSKLNNATMYTRLVEGGFIDPKRVIQIGIRGTYFSAGDLDFAKANGIRVITMDEFEELGRDGVVREIKRVVGTGETYFTFDVDGLDPPLCPGTGAPEPGGFSMRDIQVIVRKLSGLNFVGADVVEVSPPLDPAGHTAVNAANVLFEIVCLIAQGRAGQIRRDRQAAQG
ncbi:agmatinase [Aquamicrobium terrae]|uniref:Guanidinopropionase n=1 Tax=Aquamicrobium terrae TaxID=1324945 RepID=A0ABV2N0D9_9HYPH